MAQTSIYSQVKQMAERLGFSNYQDICTKADELNRLASVKVQSRCLNLNETSRTLVFLDLAADHYSYAFNLESAFKMFNIKKQAYYQSKNTLKKLLGLDKLLSVARVCSKFGFPEDVQKRAEEVLMIYRQKYLVDSGDCNHNALVAVAVYFSCREFKVRTSKSKLYEMSTVTKREQWVVLEKQIQQIVRTLTETDGKDLDHENENEMNMNMMDEGNANDSLDDLVTKLVAEDYDVWKERILKEAMAAVGSEK